MHGFFFKWHATRASGLILLLVFRVLKVCLHIPKILTTIRLWTLLR